MEATCLEGELLCGGRDGETTFDREVELGPAALW